MKEREFRQLSFGRKLSMKDLRVLLAQVSRELVANHAADAWRSRVKSILFLKNDTTVVISGSGPGLNEVATALRRTNPEVKVSKHTPGRRAQPSRSGSSSAGTKRRDRLKR
jgi:hypothetical protein